MSTRSFLTLFGLAVLTGAAVYHDAHIVSSPPAPTATPSPIVAIQPVETNGLPPLPQVALKDVPIHPVPEDTALPSDRNSDGTLRQQHVSDEVANGPRQLSSIPAPPKQFLGSATAIGPTSLQIGGAKISLFGIKPSLATDRCGTDTKSSCIDRAQQTLQADLSGNSTASCHIPNPAASTVVSYAICLNGIGIDLGGVLVSEGLALADTSQSYDYIGAENVARSQKRGLWANR